MKSERIISKRTEKNGTPALPRSAMATQKDEHQRPRDKAFMQALNEFTAKAGLLSDDPFFGGL